MGSAHEESPREMRESAPAGPHEQEPQQVGSRLGLDSKRGKESEGAQNHGLGLVDWALEPWTGLEGEQD